MTDEQEKNICAAFQELADRVGTLEDAFVAIAESQTQQMQNVTRMFELVQQAFNRLAPDDAGEPWRESLRPDDD